MPDDLVADESPEEPASDPVADDTASTQEPAAEPAAEEQPERAPDWQNWLYTGPPDRIYTNVPVTVTAGAVLHWHSPPADDGNWTATAAEPNTLPDNHHPDPGDAYLEAEAARAEATDDDDSKEG
jgi:hypothetical protein